MTGEGEEAGAAAETGTGTPVVLRLFVVGSTPRASAAITNLRRACTTLLPSGSWQIEVVDLNRQPERAADEQIIAAPTLVRKRPLPERRLVGDLADGERLRAILTLPTGEEDRP